MIFETEVFIVFSQNHLKLIASDFITKFKSSDDLTFAHAEITRDVSIWLCTVFSKP